MYNMEYEARYANRYYGKRRARVADNNDPEKRGRIKVQNAELFGNGMSDWAMPCYPFFGGRGSGFMSVPPVGSLVWIECEEGYADHIIYTGGFFGVVDDGHNSDGSPIEESPEFQEDTSAAPKHAKGYYDGSDQGGLKGNFNVPPSSFEASYGDVTILQTSAGHMLEFDDTKDGERIQIHHKKGSHIEILPDGTINIVAEGNIFTRSQNKKDFVVNNKSSEILGSEQSSVLGDFSTNISGDRNTTVEQVDTLTARSSKTTVTNDYEIDSSFFKLDTANTCLINTGGDFSLNGFGDCDIISGGRGYFSFANSMDTLIPALYVDSALSLVATNGTARLVSGDPTQEVSVYGVEARGSGGGQVYIGALDDFSRLPTLSIGPVPLLKENAVCGIQLLKFLQTLSTILDTFFGACTAPPAVPPAASAAAISLLTAQTTFLTTPSPTQPLILSESVYLSKV